MHDRRFAAFLFDMDGTIINSIEVAIDAWRKWACRHGLDADEVTQAMHGVRAAETIARFAPAGTDIDHEVALLTDAEFAAVDKIKAIAGARLFLTALPHDRWAIVTSSPRRLALQRITAAGLPMPKVLITAEDVIAGKPAPDCFIAAANRLEVEISDCLVWEDAPAGIAAGKAAGATVMIVTATHANPATNAGATIVDYQNLACKIGPDGTLMLKQIGR
ncbi:HAD-IA family hydrolase [Thalassospira mesophila]|uniref:Glycerol-3-phosphatase n=1 Tax=Thalassospira mesophila TaxID=1293891 RepID=A0A1Y2KZV9_9PROT|nr:HAD-IA family hydrolase [Thalassospira mesophila]OSQ38398.1 glycerol-3-phosphatase [Thalassospira mesophila]